MLYNDLANRIIRHPTMVGMFIILAAGVLIILGFFITVLAKTISRVVRNDQISTKRILSLAIPLALLDAIYCLYLLIKIGLLHGSKPLAAIFPLQCIMSFLVVVAFPAGLLIICRRYRSRAIMAVLSGVCAIALLSSLIWYTPGIRSSIIDDSGRPLKETYVFYYKPRYFLFSNWHTFNVTRTDAQGCFSIPADIQFQFPFEYWVPLAERITWYLRYLTIYAPSLHNLAVIYDADTGKLMDNPHRIALTKMPPKLVITLHDMTSCAEDRYDLLFQFLSRTPFKDLKGSDPNMKGLLSHMKGEYRAFAAEYGDRIREPRPASGGPVSDETQQQPQIWLFYLHSPVNGKTMEQRMAEIEESISKRHLSDMEGLS